MASFGSPPSQDMMWNTPLKTAWFADAIPDQDREQHQRGPRPDRLAEASAPQETATARSHPQPSNPGIGRMLITNAKIWEHRQVHQAEREGRGAELGERVSNGTNVRSAQMSAYAEHQIGQWAGQRHERLEPCGRAARCG